MKWGIIGAGNIANKFAKTVNDMKQNSEDESLIAVAARDLERAQTFAKEYGIPSACGSYAEMLELKEIEAVYIATPNNLHYEHTKMCLIAGKHVLCEKPFTMNADEAKELYELAQEKGLFIMEAFWIRFLPVLQKMRSIIERGEIGYVKYARSEYAFIAKGARRTRKFEAELGGGALLDIGIYNLGFMQMIMGENPTSFTSHVHMNEFDTDDFSVINLMYGANTSNVQRHLPEEDRAYEENTSAYGVVTTSIGLSMERRAVIVGTEGMIELPDFQKAESMRLQLNDGTEYEVNIPFDFTGFEYEIREVSRCVNFGKCASDIFTPEMSLGTLKLLDDIRESWKETRE